MKAIIQIDIPDYQIGQEVSIYFKDTMAIKGIVQEPKTGHWIKISPAKIYECSECGRNVMTRDICAYEFCHGCGAKMVEPPESEDKE